MGSEEGECGGPAPSWRHFSPPAPHLSGQHLCHAAGGGTAASCSPCPRQLCLPATLTSHWPGSLHQRESREAKSVTAPPLQTARPPAVQGACVGEAPRGGGHYLPHTPSLAEGEWQEPLTPITPISDVSGQKALKSAERPGKKGFRESVHIHGLKATSQPPGRAAMAMPPRWCVLRCPHHSLPAD